VFDEEYKQSVENKLDKYEKTGVECKWCGAQFECVVVPVGADKLPWGDFNRRCARCGEVFGKHNDGLYRVVG